MKETHSLLFRISLFFLSFLRWPYLALKKHYPRFFEKASSENIDLDTSKMPARHNRFHRLFFKRSFEKIRFDENELQNIKDAQGKGPLVFVMRHWGQVEYNYFNQLFLKNDLALVAHNNKVRMLHWMPAAEFKKILLSKINLFLTQNYWPDNKDFFDLKTTLKKKQPVLFCLNLTAGSHWLESKRNETQAILEELKKAQMELSLPIQLVPLHFIYDKLPGKANPSLVDIFFGEREQPGYFRKIILFLRRFKKRAVAKIGTPISLEDLIPEAQSSSPFKTSEVSEKLQSLFDQESQQVTGPKIKSRKQLVREILDSARFKEKFRHFIQQEQLPEEETRKKIATHLKRIASDLNFTAAQLWNYFLNWLFHRFYEGLIIDKNGIQQIKKIVKDAPLILVPSHKSHIDYLLLSYVFYHQNLTLPYICAGENLSFWPMGSLFRRSGAYFIRRSFAGDKIYAFALKAYVGRLMREGFTQEFFIEGTRSRSGKMFPPKTGLLAMILETFLERDLKDVYFVPVSIDYDRILEEKSYWSEIKGEEKKKEKLTDLFRLGKFLKKRYGKVYIQFSNPISLRESLPHEALQFEARRASEHLAPLLARKITREIQKISTILPTAIVASALLTPLKPSQTFEEIQIKSGELWSFTQGLNPRLSEAFQKEFSQLVRETLTTWQSEGFILRHEGIREKFYTVPETSRVALNFFKNQGLAFWAEASLESRAHTLSSALKTPPAPPETLLKNLKQLLELEFTFSDCSHSKLVLPPWASTLLDPLLESYWLTLRSIQDLNFEKIPQNGLLRKILENGRSLLLQGKLTYTECLSRFNIQNALSQYAQMNLLKVESAKVNGKHIKLYSSTENNAEELQRILKAIKSILDSAKETL